MRKRIKVCSENCSNFLNDANLNFFFLTNGEKKSVLNHLSMTYKKIINFKDNGRTCVTIIF